MVTALILSAALTAVPGQPPAEFPPDPPVLAPAPTPLPPGPLLVPGQPMSHWEFADLFVPTPGRHRVTLIHPVSKCAVDVCFELPCGCVRCVTAGKRAVVFDYGKHSVTLVFRVLGGGGRVDVVTR
jgi:hypothetical protein